MAYHDRRGRVNEQRQAVREEGIKAYGGRCACCGETYFKFLQLDHSWNDGLQRRREFFPTRPQGLGGIWYLYKLKALGWPQDLGLRILCANCHHAVSCYGGCDGPGHDGVTGERGAFNPKPKEPVVLPGAVEGREPA